MFKKVASSFWQAKIFVVFICAFSFSFFLLLQDVDDFSRVHYSFVKTIVMGTGEMDFSDLFHDAKEEKSERLLSRSLAYLIYIVFVVVIVLLVMNLLTALAIGEIQEIQSDAKLEKIAIKIDAILLDLRFSKNEKLRKYRSIYRPNNSGNDQNTDNCQEAEIKLPPPPPSQEEILLKSQCMIDQLQREMKGLFGKLKTTQEVVKKLETVDVVEKLKAHEEGLSGKLKKTQEVVVKKLEALDVVVKKLEAQEKTTETILKLIEECNCNEKLNKKVSLLISAVANRKKFITRRKEERRKKKQTEEKQELPSQPAMGDAEEQELAIQPEMGDTEEQELTILPAMGDAEEQRKTHELMILPPIEFSVEPSAGEKPEHERLLNQYETVYPIYAEESELIKRLKEKRRKKKQTEEEEEWAIQLEDEEEQWIHNLFSPPLSPIELSLPRGAPAPYMAKDREKEEIDLTNCIWIDAGSDGDIYKFSDEHGPFVLKVPKQIEKSAAFKKECQKLTQIKNPNVVKYFAVVNVDDNHRMKLGIKMEFCERGSFKNLIFNPTIIYSMEDISVWAEQLFGALAFIFDDHKIIHRDIKAANIFVKADFALKLGGFGSLYEGDVESDGEWYIGTPRYMSPPQFDLENLEEEPQKVSHKNDVYSMGLVIWELIERRVVLSEYDGYSGFDYGRFISEFLLQKLTHVQVPTCLGKMRDIVQNCTRFDRTKRPKASDVLEQIKTLNQANGDRDQVTLIEDPNEKRLIRPIGFNGQKNRQPIDE